MAFGNIEGEKHKIHQRKRPISIYDIKIDRILACNKAPFGKNAFTYFFHNKNDDEKVMLLCIMLPKMSAY